MLTVLTPQVAPRIAVAADGAHVAIVERATRDSGGDGGRITVVRVADGESVCGLAIPNGEVDVAWLAARLVVIATGELHTSVTLLDPLAAADHRKLAEIRLETAMRFGAATDRHALLLGPRAAAVLTSTDSAVAPYQFLARTLPTVVGVAGALFVVALPGTIEEWDPVSRMPKRRLRLPRAATITSLGGSERVLWMTTLQEPARLDVLPIVNRGQPKAHELPESIKSVHGHPHSDLVVCIGAETGQLYAIDLDTRGKSRTIVTGLERADIAALAIARDPAVAPSTTPTVVATAIAARAGQPIAIVPLGGHEPDVDKPPSVLTDALSDALFDPTGADGTVPSPIGVPSRPASIDQASGGDAPGSSRPPISRAAAAARALAKHAPAPALAIDPEPLPEPQAPPPEPRAPTAWSEGASELMAKLAALRAAGLEPGSPDAPQRATWRDDAGAWARAVASGTFDRAAPACPPIDVLATRFELPAPLIPALVLIYGSHLAGLEGAAPMDVARVLGRRWDDALGRGKLAELGLTVHERSRVMLAPAILRELDELPQATEPTVTI